MMPIARRTRHGLRWRKKKIDAGDPGAVVPVSDSALAKSWEYAQQGASGWEAEHCQPGRPFEEISLPKTVQALGQIKHWMADQTTIDARAAAKTSPKIAATLAQADKTYEAALSKLDAAYNQWLDAAEAQSSPERDAKFNRLGRPIRRSGEDWFAGTKYAIEDVTRAKKLDQRWKDEVTGQHQDRQDALERMTDAANAAWPKILAATHAEEGFHASDAAAFKGKTVRFKAVRNRTGWDFDGQYEIVIWVDGQALAGSYEPNVRKAFKDAAAKIGDSVNDHINWDIVAVIEGRGRVNRRNTTEVLAQNRQVLGKIESYDPMDCILMRVIAVHAGPVAVGPN